MTEEPDGLLGWLDGPRVVVGAFAFFLLGLTFLGILLWTDLRSTVERVDRLQQERLIEEQAAKKDQVTGCFSRAAQGPALQRVLLAIELETSNPEARQDIRDFRELNALNSPTVRECRQLANQLNVPIPRSIR